MDRHDSRNNHNDNYVVTRRTKMKKLIEIDEKIFKALPEDSEFWGL